MPVPSDFLDESLYAEDCWFIHDILEIDKEGGRIVGELDTTRLGQLGAAQRPVGGHAPHVPAAVMIQMTGTLGQMHAIWVLGLRATEGWIGYGTHMKSARFRNLATVGAPIRAELTATRVRWLRNTCFVDYKFRYLQDGQVVYESEQTAAWLKGDAPA
jgi:3-hydroxymyristoyl/3-hydroxydecanoyl-(acyl carrier protein) dehydratase